MLLTTQTDVSKEQQSPGLPCLLSSAFNSPSLFRFCLEEITVYFIQCHNPAHRFKDPTKNKHIINNKMMTCSDSDVSFHLSSFLSLFCTGLKPSIYLYRAYAYTYLHTYTCVYINTCIYTPHTHSTSIIYNFINIAY